MWSNKWRNQFLAVLHRFSIDNDEEINGQNMWTFRRGRIDCIDFYPNAHRTHHKSYSFPCFHTDTRFGTCRPLSINYTGTESDFFAFVLVGQFCSCPFCYTTVSHLPAKKKTWKLHWSAGSGQGSSLGSDWAWSFQLPDGGWRLFLWWWHSKLKIGWMMAEKVVVKT